MGLPDIPEETRQLLNLTSEGRAILRASGFPTEAQMGAKEIAAVDRERKAAERQQRLDLRSSPGAMANQRAARQQERRDLADMKRYRAQGLPANPALLPDIRKMAAGEGMSDDLAAAMLPPAAYKERMAFKTATDPKALRASAFVGAMGQLSNSQAPILPGTIAAVAREAANLYPDDGFPGQRAPEGAFPPAQSATEQEAIRMGASLPGGLYQRMGGQGEASVPAFSQLLQRKLEMGLPIAPQEWAELRQYVANEGEYTGRDPFIQILLQKGSVTLKDLQARRNQILSDTTRAMSGWQYGHAF